MQHVPTHLVRLTATILMTFLRMPTDFVAQFVHDLLRHILGIKLRREAMRVVRRIIHVL
jgi:hypothetical protein